MKKMLMILCLITIFAKSGICQSYDDRLVSRNMNVNTTEEQYQSYVSGFREGANRVKTGAIKNMDDISRQTGVDILKLHTLDEYVDGSVSWNVCSSPFLIKLKTLVDNADQFENIPALRNELVRISQSGNLNQKDQEALALIDIAAQETEKLRKKNGNTTFGTGNLIHGSDLLNSVHTDIPENNNSEVDIPWVKNWLLCIFGTLGSAITMAVSGGTLGGTIGSIVGPVGTATGAVVGAVIGGIGGTITGIIKYCR